MTLKKVKDLLKGIEILRLVTKENEGFYTGERIRIFDLFLNGDGLVRPEVYDAISRKDLDEYKENENITANSINNILADIKMWTVYAEDNSNKDDNVNVNIDCFFDRCDDLEQIRKLNTLNRDEFDYSLINFINNKSKYIYLKLAWNL